MKNKLIIGIIAVFLVFWMGTLFQNVEGTYVAKHNKNTNDTVKLFKDGTYYRALYNKSNSRLIFSNKGTWEDEDDRIILQDFYDDNDEDYTGRKLNFDNVLMTYSAPIEHSFGKIVFGYEKVADSFKYYKLW